MSKIHFGKMEYHNYKENKFWEEVEEGKNYSISIIKADVVDFLIKKKFGKLYKNGKMIYVRIINKRVIELDQELIRDYVLEYVRNTDVKLAEHCTNKEIVHVLINGSGNYLNRDTFRSLNKVELQFGSDGKNSSNFFFKYSYVKVTKEKIELLEYKRLKGHVWYDQIIDHNFKINKNTSDFEKFIKNVCGNNEERFEAIKSTIGYLLSTYKNPSLSKAIIFCDEGLNKGDDPNGRTGKSLIGKAIGKMRKLADIKGQEYDHKDKFRFQKVGIDTDVILFNDVPGNFNFEKLFSSITEGYDIERKFAHKIQIPFKEAPKTLITTNYSILGRGSSHRDRIHEVEFYNFYSDTHKPIDDFGKNFFDDWNEDEWNAFNTFMFSCVQVFLSKGLIKYRSINLDKKKILQQVGETFFEFAEKIKLDKKHNKKDLYEFYIEKKNDFIVTSQKTFSKFLNDYASYKGYKMISTKSNNENFFMLTKPKE
ncbi:MAG: hypothetical protein V3V16_15830 [Melioribacteraceae bacterium]